MSIQISEKLISEIDCIQPLWENLNQIHLEKSMHFRDKYTCFTFEQRKKDLLKKAERSTFRIFMLEDMESGSYNGYLVASADAEDGEIESIYVETKLRGMGFGGKLMEAALAWLNDQNTSQISINVVYANDDALPFYEKFGFRIANYILRQPKIYKNQTVNA